MEPTPPTRASDALDLYLPEGVTEFPSIVWFHGGNLEGGDKSGEMTVAIARRFAGDGIAVATVNYRLHPQVSFPTYIEDAAASVAWLVRNISEHGGDPAKVFVSGHSAGGYLTAMVGLDPRYLREHELDATNLAGLIPVSGQMVTHSTVRRERGIARTTPVIDAGAPSYYVREGLPPIFSICGSEDLPREPPRISTSSQRSTRRVMRTRSTSSSRAATTDRS